MAPATENQTSTTTTPASRKAEEQLAAAEAQAETFVKTSQDLVEESAKQAKEITDTSVSQAKEITDTSVKHLKELVDYGISKSKELVATTSDQWLALTGQGQKLTLGAVRSWTDTLGKIVPQAPVATAYPAAGNLDKSLKAQFDFAEHLLGIQRDFATSVVAALAPKAG